ncbi:AfsR/SARP family transcriptional regulator [Actinophytocola sp.]|uniref:AfsR/SARP family transcriptional regulator n=1 Tax=Actinophytocola sp. TaxID=1872138 RepID=UPI003D6C4652
MSQRLYFSVLGTVRVTRAGQPVRLGGPRLRTLLATLLLCAGRPVSLERIGDRLWEHTPPAQVRRVIQTYIVRLRQVLDGHDLIQTDPGGYLIRVDPDQLDVLRFDTLLGVATATSDVARRAALLSEALSLWRGPACADIVSSVLQSRDVAPIGERRLDAEERLIDAELALGRHVARVPHLRRLVVEYPLRERFTAQLMLALYRSGRRADALTAYLRTRDVLVEEFGIEPGAELQQVHRQVLGAGPGTDPPGPVAERLHVYALHIARAIGDHAVERVALAGLAEIRQLRQGTATVNGTAVKQI